MRDARGLHQPLPAAHRRPLAHPALGSRGLVRSHGAGDRRSPARPGRARRGAVCLARGGGAKRCRAGLPVRVCGRRGGGVAPRGRGSSGGRRDGAPPARDLRPRPLSHRAAASLLAPRPAPQPASVGARRAARSAVRGHGQHPCARAGAHSPAGRHGRRAAGGHARRDRAPPPRQLVARALAPRAHGPALSRPPRRRGGERAAGRAPSLRPHRGSRLSLSRRGGSGRRSQPGRALPGGVRGALLRASQPRGGDRPARRGAAGDPSSGAVRLLPSPPRHARAGPGGGGGGARPGVGAAADGAGAGEGLERVLDRLLPHRSLARRPDRERAAARALPQRGAHRASGHRPRLPARHPRRPDPARARPLRPRPLCARGRLRHLPGALGGAGLRQGAGAAAG